MTTHIAWSAIAVRLLLTALASAAIGINRGEQDRPVGLRTTMLVGLAAAISMVQVNLLLPVAGKASDSFVVMDLMRLPLGILSGMGFIGAGAILRRDNAVQGVTTAATLWFVTTMGLCFGGGQIGLGLAAFLLAVFVLWPLKWLERSAGRERRGELSFTIEGADAIEDTVRSRVATAGYRVDEAASISADGGRRTVGCSVRWHEGAPSASPTQLNREITDMPGVLRVYWRSLDRQ